jgi:hypothetical protein
VVGAEVQHAVGYIAVVIAAHAGVTVEAHATTCVATSHALEACMHTSRTFVVALLLASLGLVCLQVAWAAAEPLPSWQDGAGKRAIIDFVARVTMPGGPAFVPASERIATFDNDGTLWAEQPMYFPLAFVLDRVKAFAPQHPEWRDQPPLKAGLEGDLKTLAASGEKGMLELGMATHAGMTTEAFEQIVKG